MRVDVVMRIRIAYRACGSPKIWGRPNRTCKKFPVTCLLVRGRRIIYNCFLMIIHRIPRGFSSCLPRPVCLRVEGHVRHVLLDP